MLNFFFNKEDLDIVFQLSSKDHKLTELIFFKNSEQLTFKWYWFKFSFFWTAINHFSLRKIFHR